MTARLIAFLAVLLVALGPALAQTNPLGGLSASQRQALEQRAQQGPQQQGVLIQQGVASQQGESAAEERAFDLLSEFSEDDRLPMFGSQLFNRPPAASRSAADASYQLMTGDRIAVRAFGAYNADVVSDIDSNGFLFIPEVGPVNLAGRRVAGLQSAIEEAVRRTFTDNVRVYATLLTPGTVSVYVSGDVPRPGRFVGGSNDDVLYFLGLAGGPHPERGSYRDIRVMRNDKLVARIDLYAFLLSGQEPDIDLRSGDVIFVTQRGPVVGASGDVSAPFAYEMLGTRTGKALIDLVRPDVSATNVILTGTRDREPFKRYFTLDQFRSFPLQTADKVRFSSNAFGNDIAVAVQTTSPDVEAVYILPRKAKLSELLSLMSLDTSLVDPNSIHVNRLSVAQQQRDALESSLARLERSAYLATSISNEAAALNRAQASAISAFVSRARRAEPAGTITVMENGELNDLALEDGDVIVIPDKTDVILVAGEVMSPGAFVAGRRERVGDYVERAGGFQSQANKREFVLIKRSGAALRVGARHVPEAGDQILVLPKTSGNAFILAKDITQIIFQLALSTATVARL